MRVVRSLGQAWLASGWTLRIRMLAYFALPLGAAVLIVSGQVAIGVILLVVLLLDGAIILPIMSARARARRSP
jgi:peptidoglycan/LPS O-acetylase OafA/YrhL